MMATNRILWIDLAKFTGISMVVFDHVATGLCNSGIGLSATALEIQRIVSSFHVPLFFVLSGYLFAIQFSCREWLSFTLKRWDRLIYLCILWSILQALSQAVFTNYTNNPHSILDISPLSLVLDPKGQFWFLYSLFYITAASALVYRLGGNSSVLLLVSFIFLLVANRFGGMVERTFLHFVYFAIGICVTDVLRQRLDVFFRKAIAGTVFLCFGLLHSCTPMVLDGTKSLLGSVWQFLTAVSGILLVLTICVNLPRTGKGLTNYLGRHSMEILLMHMMAAAGLRIVLIRVFGVNDMLILLAACTAGGLLIPVLTASVIQKLNLTFLFTCPDWLSLQKRLPAAR